MLLFRGVLVMCAFLINTGAISDPKDNTIKEDASGEHKPEDPVEEEGRMEQCVSEWDFECLKMNLITNMNKVRFMKSYKLFEGVELEKLPEGNDDDDDSSAVLTEDQLESSLPRSTMEREERLDKLLEDGMSRIFSSHSLKLNFDPEVSLKVTRSKTKDGFLSVALETSEGDRALGKDGSRKKLKRILPLLLIPLLIKAGFIPIAIGALSVIAFKALLAGKISLLLTGIQWLSNTFGKHGHQEQQHSYQGYHAYQDYMQQEGIEGSQSNQLDDVNYAETQEMAYNQQLKQKRRKIKV